MLPNDECALMPRTRGQAPRATHVLVHGVDGLNRRTRPTGHGVAAWRRTNRWPAIGYGLTACRRTRG
jgi:hypothetical protein